MTRRPIRHLAVIALLMGVFAPLAGLHAQDTGTKIEMRPDEAFWNAVRDLGDENALRLFIATHPDSPYRAEAEKRLAAGGGEVAAPAVEPDTPKPASRPALDEIVAALQRLGLDPLDGKTGTPDEARLEDSLGSYLFYATMDIFKFNPTLPASDVELSQLIYFSNHSKAWTDAGYDHDVIGQVLFRLRSAYTALKQSEPPDDLAELVMTLQADAGLPVTGDLDKQLLANVASGPVVYEFTPFSHEIVFGDWLLVRDTFSSGTCFLVVGDDKFSWNGPYLTAYPPNTTFFMFDVERRPPFTVFWDPGRLFRPDTPLTWSADGQDVILDPDWESVPITKGDKASEVLALLRRARGPVTLSGTSGFGAPLELKFTGNGFTAALREMNKSCADGKLAAFLK